MHLERLRRPCRTAAFATLALVLGAPWGPASAEAPPAGAARTSLVVDLASGAGRPLVATFTPTPTLAYAYVVDRPLRAGRGAVLASVQTADRWRHALVLLSAFPLPAAGLARAAVADAAVPSLFHDDAVGRADRITKPAAARVRLAAGATPAWSATCVSVYPPAEDPAGQSVERATTIFWWEVEGLIVRALVESIEDPADAGAILAGLALSGRRSEPPTTPSIRCASVRQGIRILTLPLDRGWSVPRVVLVEGSAALELVRAPSPTDPAARVMRLRPCTGTGSDASARNGAAQARAERLGNEVLQLVGPTPVRVPGRDVDVLVWEGAGDDATGRDSYHVEVILPVLAPEPHLWSIDLSTVGDDRDAVWGEALVVAARAR